MAKLSEKDLALLSSLIYCDYVVEQKPGIRLGVVVNSLLDIINDGSKTIEREKLIEGLTGDFGYFKKQKSDKEEGNRAALHKLEEVLLKIRTSQSLMDLKITNPKQNDKSPSGITAACFVDNENCATVVFRGTDGSYKAWFDNFEGAGTTVATPMQEAAKKYIDGLEYQDITVTGHSKGGNLAVFVTVLCDKVSNAVSFDGQGFSEAFCKQYQERIAERQERITTIAADQDIVNTLLMSIGKTFYVKTSGTGFATSHLMTNLIFQGKFDDENNYTGFVGQHFGTALLEWALDSLVIKIPDITEEWLTDVFGAVGAVFTETGDGSMCCFCCRTIVDT